MNRELPKEFATGSKNSLSSKSYPGFPWHERSVIHQQEKRFNGLTLLHELTLKWIEFLKIKRAPYLMERGLNPSVVENLWMLESLSERKLEDFLDETSTDDVLGRLDYTIWAVQAYTLQHILDRTSANDRASLDATLEQAAWRLGRRTAEERALSFSVAARNDLTSLVLTSVDLPFIGHWNGRSLAPAENPAILLKRAIRTEVLLELRLCPHHHPYPEVREIADPLCQLHSHWLRGYAYGLNPRVAMEIKPGNMKKGIRCEQRWHFITNPKP